jgi:AcrR family transcriptional regulator
MNAVAQRAGVSTKTLYRLIPTKADLFGAYVARRIDGFMLAIDDESLAGLAMPDALERVLIAFGTLTLDQETTALMKLVIGECDRFPELSAAFYEVAINRTKAAMVAWLQRQADAGLLRLDDPFEACGMLRGMMIMEPQRAVMLGMREAPGPEEIAARAKAAARLFLNGCCAGTTLRCA